MISLPLLIVIIVVRRANFTQYKNEIHIDVLDFIALLLTLISISSSLTMNENYEINFCKIISHRHHQHCESWNCRFLHNYPSCSLIHILSCQYIVWVREGWLVCDGVFSCSQQQLYEYKQFPLFFFILRRTLAESFIQWHNIFSCCSMCECVGKSRTFSAFSLCEQSRIDLMSL